MNKDKFCICCGNLFEKPLVIAHTTGLKFRVCQKCFDETCDNWLGTQWKVMPETSEDSSNALKEQT